MNVIASKRILWITAVASLVILPSAGTAWAKSHKAYVCHKGHTISIDKRAVHAHLKHGDSLGRCNSCACDQTYDPVSCADGKDVRQRVPGHVRQREWMRPRVRLRPDLRSSVLRGRQDVRQRVPGHVRRRERMPSSACAHATRPRSSVLRNGKTYANACLATCAGQTNCTTPPTLPCAAFPCGGTNRLICHIPR